MPIQIIAGRKYVISVNNHVGVIPKDYFVAGKKPGQQDIKFPVTKGGITIDGKQETRCDGICYPSSFYMPSTLSGFPDFVFEPDN